MTRWWPFCEGGNNRETRRPRRSWATIRIQISNYGNVTMVKKCPRCGVQYTEAALKMFETTVKAGFKINLTCGNCGAAMVIDESQLSQPASPKASSAPKKQASPSGSPRVARKWWQFWK